MKPEYYFYLKSSLIENGYADEIQWQTNLKPCDNAENFRDEAIWVILNSGMKNQVARLIYNRLKSAWAEGKSSSSAFGHKGKCSAIDSIRFGFDTYFYWYLRADNKVDYLETIPFIGKITKWHLAKSLGHDCVKPDRHLVRIANNYGYYDCIEMCKSISRATNDKICVVDIILWRSANLGWI